MTENKVLIDFEFAVQGLDTEILWVKTRKWINRNFWKIKEHNNDYLIFEHYPRDGRNLFPDDSLIEMKKSSEVTTIRFLVPKRMRNQASEESYKESIANYIQFLQVDLSIINWQGLLTKNDIESVVREKLSGLSICLFPVFFFAYVAYYTKNILPLFFGLLLLIRAILFLRDILSLLKLEKLLVLS